MICKFCNAEIEDGSKVCPFCEKELTEEVLTAEVEPVKKKKKGSAAMVLAIIAGIVDVVAIPLGLVQGFISLILAIVAGILAIIALILSIVALVKAGKAKDKNKTISIVALIIAIVALVFAVALIPLSVVAMVIQSTIGNFVGLIILGFLNRIIELFLLLTGVM